jgi:hypothetical protein
MSTPNLLRYEWLTLLQTPGCALCRLAVQKSQHYIDTLLDEAVMDVEQRERWRAARGLCAWHATMALQTPQSASSVALLYADVLRHDLQHLAELTTPIPTRWRRRRTLQQRLQDWLHTWRQQQPCPVCALWQAQERLYLRTLLDDWPAGELVHAFRLSTGICWPHTQRLVEQGQQHVHLPSVLSVQQSHLQRVQAELREFIRKQDYRFASAPYGPEADAWRRVVALYGGRQDGKGDD